MLYTVVMYIDEVPNRNSRPTILLRESCRKGKRVLKRTLANISHWERRKIENLRRVLQGDQLVSPDDFYVTERSLPHGHVEAVLGTIRKLGLDSLIATKPSRQRDLVLAMIVGRILHPSSKLASTRLWHASTLAEELKVQDAVVDELYQAMDWLLARQRHIQKKLADRHLSPGCGAGTAPGCRVLYDLSSSSYYGRKCGLAALGRNRDRRKDLCCIAYGVMTDQDGRPVAVDVYPGNTGDPTTVPDQVAKLRDQFGLSEVVLVGDRGMLPHNRIDQLKGYPGLGWITALRSGDIRKLMDRRDLQLSLFEKQNLAEIQSDEFPGERLVACYNPVLADERRRKRADLLAATEKCLDKLVAEVARRTRTPLTEKEIALKAGNVRSRYKVGKHYELTIEDGHFAWERREEAIRREEELDGIYVIRTSESSKRAPAPVTVRSYKDLAHVERVFRCLKGLDLRVRPIHHHLDDRVRAHIFLCVLAYYVEWHMRQALAPLLFEDEELDETRKCRDPVAPAVCSAGTKRKKSTTVTEDGFPVHSYGTLFKELSTRCRHFCRVKSDPIGSTFTQINPATPLQARASELLGL